MADRVDTPDDAAAVPDLGRGVTARAGAGVERAHVARDRGDAAAGEFADGDVRAHRAPPGLVLTMLLVGVALYAGFVRHASADITKQFTFLFNTQYVGLS